MPWTYETMYVWRKKRTTIDNLGHMRLCLEDPKEKEDYCRQPWTHETMSGGKEGNCRCP